MELSTIISLVGITIAVVTFFLTNIQSAKIIATIGPFIKIYYADYDSGGSVGLYLPVTFVNLTNKLGIVLNAAIALYNNETPDEVYLLQWRDFQKFDVDENQWEFEEMAHALAVNGRSTVTKVVWFMWTPDSQPKFIFRKGAYTISFYFWSNNRKSPKVTTHQFSINESIYNKLEGYRANEKRTTTNIRLDREIDENQHLTRHEVKKLFKLVLSNKE